MERDSRKLIRLLERDGWVRVAVRGSHWQFKHPNRTGHITAPHPNRNLKRGTVASIYRRAAWIPRRD
ncbi:MAG: type II toxin-antitoxin system HicA family toxin [Acidobacteria bacterium]|nr:type II toxin-antitoxin system HicA family toxin [Acidobacteriota bacterium]